ncbi:phosphoglyceromutase, partial [Candidatus Magnetomorum sp. HK-1]
MILLTILDGWGISKKEKGNGFKLANTPNLDRLLATYPNTRVLPSGIKVGLPEGQMGNSEVGHLNIGAGRIVNQSYQRVNVAIKDKSFFQNKELLDAMQHVKTNNSELHLMGLVSDGGVHSSMEHLYAAMQLAKEQGVSQVYIHCFMDGRDTSPVSGKKYLALLLDKIAEIGIGKIATIIGRYYAMDRDNRWERVEKAYNAIVNGKGTICVDPIIAMEQSYAKNIT